MIHREKTLRKTAFNATPYCDGWFPTSLYGWKNFRVKVDNGIGISSLDVSKALSNTDDHCRADAKLFRKKIELMDELWVRDDHIIKQFVSWFSSTKAEVREHNLLIDIGKEYIFAGRWFFKDRNTLVFEVSKK